MINNTALAKLLLFPVLTVLGCQNPARGGAPDALQGILELDEQPLAFELPGRVKKILVKRGDEIKAGQPLGELDDTLDLPLRDARAAELRGAEAQAQLIKAGVRKEELRTTEAQLIAARENEGRLDRALKRTGKLAESGAGVPVQVEEIQSQLARAQAERQSLEERLAAQRSGARAQEHSTALARVHAAQAALQQIEARLLRYTLRAPADGRVLDVHLDPGDVVAVGTPVLTVADAKRPYADVFVPEGRMLGLKIGSPATLRVDGDPQPYRGTVEDIARRTEFTPKFLFSERERPNLVVRVKIRVDDPGEKLHAGVPAFVVIGGAK
jgi:HlyD family secretion protein